MRKTILKGAIGKALEKTIACRFKQLDYKLLAAPFIQRNETDGAWRCEFWGKVIRPAITYAFVTGDLELRKLIDDSVADILSSQTPDGCISSYPREQQLSGWDLWGRKYALLGLIRYYELLNPDPTVLQACCRALDYLISQVGPEGTDILKCGWHNGLAASSILGAVVALWRLSGEKRYYNFARYIISRGCSGLGNIYECCDLGLGPAVLGNGKAYEMTSCFQGMAELALLEDAPSLKETVVKYYKAVLEQEIFITGTGGAKDICGEFWYNGSLRQTRSDCGALGETCVTVTWMRYCLRILELTGDSSVADVIERSLYNALLGAWAPDGTNWVHANPTPLTGGGYKKCADDQIKRGFGTPYGGNDCCRAQGPEGFAVAAEFAVMESSDTVTVNMFESLDSDTLKIRGNYPAEPRAEITFTDTETKCLRLRTPEFLKSVKFNGKSVDFAPGVYLELPHIPCATDVIELEFDFSLREISSPCSTGFTAVMRGPLVLAEDSNGKSVSALVSESWQGRMLCDYASAGRGMSKDNTLTVWFK